MSLHKYVAVIDDNETDRLLVQAQLQTMGILAMTFASGDEFLDHWHQNTTDPKSKNSDAPAMIIVDLQMPKLNGIELIKRTKGIPGLTGIPIMILSGRAEAKDVKVGIRVGANDYVIKPLDPAVFEEKIRTWLKMSGSSAQWYMYEIKNPDHAIGGLLRPIRLVRLNELFLEIETEFNLNAETVLDIEIPAFARIGVKTRTFQVLKCEKKKENLYQVRLRYLGLTNSDLKLIRLFCREVYVNQGESGAAA